MSPWPSSFRHVPARGDEGGAARVLAGPGPAAGSRFTAMSALLRREGSQGGGTARAVLYEQDFAGGRSAAAGNHGDSLLPAHGRRRLQGNAVRSRWPGSPRGAPVQASWAKPSWRSRGRCEAFVCSHARAPSHFRRWMRLRPGARFRREPGVQAKEARRKRGGPCVLRTWEPVRTCSSPRAGRCGPIRWFPAGGPWSARRCGTWSW